MQSVRREQQAPVEDSSRLLRRYSGHVAMVTSALAGL